MPNKLWAQMSLEEKLDTLHHNIERLIEIASEAATDVDSRLARIEERLGSSEPGWSERP
jgi:hypothetical protein